MINVVYSDSDIIVCEKPIGTLSEGDMPALLCEQCALAAPPFVVHRLDRGTGGLMVYAVTKKAAAALSGAITGGTFKKEYLAAVHGRPEQTAGTWRDLLYHDAKKNKSYVVTRERHGVREAVLDYELQSSVETDSGTLSLVLIRLHTGRTHQIRVQFSHRHMPLFGDRRYGARDSGSTPALWSHRLSFPHPATGESMTFTLPAPEGVPWGAFR